MGDIKPIEDTTLEEWDRTVAIDQTGVFLGMKIAAPHLKTSEHASVINISSIFGTSGGFGVSPAYHAAKGAVRTLTKNVALHWATEGVRVNSIHPGFIATPILEQARDTPIWDGMTALTPMGTPGPSRRHRRRRRLPRQRRRGLHHRSRALHRRRLHGPLKTDAIIAVITSGAAARYRVSAAARSLVPTASSCCQSVRSPRVG